MIEPLGRSRALLGLTETLSRHGVDSKALLAKTGIDFDPADEPERWVPFRAILACYELAAQQSRRPDFGLELAQSRDFAFFGPLNLILKYAPNFETALKEFQRFASVQVSGGYETSLQSSGDTCIYEFFVTESMRPISNQWVEESLLTTVKTARMFLGADYSPRAIYVKHSPISSKKKYVHYFGVAPEFDSEIDGVAFHSSAFKVRNRAEDLDVLGLVTSVLAVQVGWTQGDLASNVRSLIRRSLPTGQFSIEVIADQLCTSRRTLQRQLAQRNLSYEGLLEEVRMMLSAELLEDGNLRLSSIAYHLGFREQSAFNHAFKRWYGVTPGERRRRSRMAKGEGADALATRTHSDQDRSRRGDVNALSRAD
ncbi:MAG: AraC family transcriptional regulator [Aquincola sp.]|nr:AraC family transcriptional regulator [Aquincola sp.]MDH4288456.1 AraC family transcriptional regulator [Aquincola sp.]MDH5330066.1 AraC family transcriptional regulator [Aquincola sp.]